MFRLVYPFCSGRKAGRARARAHAWRYLSGAHFDEPEEWRVAEVGSLMKNRPEMTARRHGVSIVAASKTETTVGVEV